MKSLKAPFRLLYNNDTTNTLSCVSPWHEQGQPFREEMLVASIDEVAGHGVDAYLLSPGLGWIPWWQSTVYGDHYEWWTRKTGLEDTQGYFKYVADGGDMVQVLIDTCRKHDMAPFVSYRLNDVHHMEHCGRRTPLSILVSRFYEEHPEYLINPEHAQIEGYRSDRGQNWAIPEVREYKFALIRELIENYDLAGLELDFLRDNTLFRLDETSEEERIEIVSGFVARVRGVMDRAGGPRRYLCVRIPLELRAHGDIGLDVPRLYDAGVDMFNLSGWYHTTQRFDVAETRRLVPNAAIYVEMTHSTGRHPYFMAESHRYGTAGDPRTSDHQFYTTAHLARQRGADGLSLFNFVYYRPVRIHDDIPTCEPPFHVLDKLCDAAFLARQPQYYMLGGTRYHRQLPRPLAPGKPEHFEMDIAPPSGWSGGRLRLHTDQPVSGDHQIAACINGVALDATNDVSRLLGNPFDRMISPLQHRRAWLVPPDAVRDGLNDLEFTRQSGDDVNVVYIDMALT